MDDDFADLLDEPALTDAERKALHNIRRKQLRRKAQEELASQRLAPWGCLVLDKATGEIITLMSGPDQPSTALD